MTISQIVRVVAFVNPPVLPLVPSGSMTVVVRVLSFVPVALWEKQTSPCFKSKEIYSVRLPGDLDEECVFTASFSRTVPVLVPVSPEAYAKKERTNGKERQDAHKRTSRLLPYLHGCASRPHRPSDPRREA
jgi:hypothetical protein